jgi:hypothetical protein
MPPQRKVCRVTHATRSKREHETEIVVLDHAEHRQGSLKFDGGMQPRLDVNFSPSRMPIAGLGNCSDLMEHPFPADQCSRGCTYSQSAPGLSRERHRRLRGTEDYSKASKSPEGFERQYLDQQGD